MIIKETIINNIKPCFISETLKNKENKIETSYPITVKLGANEDLITIAASGPYMKNGSIQTDQLELLIDMVKAKNAHVLILV